ncbi:hypothetical protein GLA29479_444 [Lysobacter antibioticus]|uniref:Uncharacterized protein n=1 Tax=Lysobacter antibioticus TaxID=84531 RepID=A0A0S2DS25_LYSAN|nr:hypothetical protein GLA29479_444 [Lysobacter antibioticus]ALN83016.1 hypothetical protein LA76x_4913 [Lysobacter antibioticus]
MTHAKGKGLPRSRIGARATECGIASSSADRVPTEAPVDTAKEAPARKTRSIRPGAPGSGVKGSDRQGTAAGRNRGRARDGARGGKDSATGPQRRTSRAGSPAVRVPASCADAPASL